MSGETVLTEMTARSDDDQFLQNHQHSSAVLHYTALDTESVVQKPMEKERETRTAGSGVDAERFYVA
jgi:hypothetical protein